jgi:hypothetical protein
MVLLGATDSDRRGSVNVPTSEEDMVPRSQDPSSAGTEVSTDSVMVVLRLVGHLLTDEERKVCLEMESGTFVPLETILPLWESIARRIPDQMKTAIKGMIYRGRGILSEMGVRTPADALRVSNAQYQTFNRGPRIGGRQVVVEKRGEVIVDESTWQRCEISAWFIEAYVRAFGARGVRIEHLNPCRIKGDRYCRFRVRWSRVEQTRGV